MEGTAIATLLKEVLLQVAKNDSSYHQWFDFLDISYAYISTMLTPQADRLATKYQRE
jgi:hypothetical protein